MPVGTKVGVKRDAEAALLRPGHADACPQVLARPGKHLALAAPRDPDASPVLDPAGALRVARWRRHIDRLLEAGGEDRPADAVPSGRDHPRTVVPQRLAGKIAAGGQQKDGGK